MALPEKYGWEPSPRWVRVQFNGELIADSKNVALAWEGAGARLNYYFPAADVRAEFLQQTGRSGGDRRTYHVTAGERTAENAAWSYSRPPHYLDGLEGYIAFRWSKMDHWYEEDEEVFVHPRDPYKRVDTLPSTRHVRVAIDGVTVAETKRPFLLFETNLPTRYYISPQDVRMELLTPTDTHTRCPYKGEASYWSVTIGDQTYKDIVWGYPDPIPEAPKIKGLLCFYNEKVDIYLDGELQERPQSPWS